MKPRIGSLVRITVGDIIQGVCLAYLYGEVIDIGRSSGAFLVSLHGYSVSLSFERHEFIVLQS